jgi:hypothetical protein
MYGDAYPWSQKHYHKPAPKTKALVSITLILCLKGWHVSGVIFKLHWSLNIGTVLW